MKTWIRMQRLGLIGGATFIPLAAVFLLAVLSIVVSARLEDAVSSDPMLVQQPTVLQHRTSAQDNGLQNAFVFRFDPALQSFETFTIPTSGANPNSVAVISDGTTRDVWFTQPDTDSIGRLIYTGTNDYSFPPPYQVGEQPLNLVADESRGWVWFTEQAANRIGRLQIGSSYDVTYTWFAVDTPDSQPAGIDLAPDRTVWFTEMAGDKIGHLVPTTGTAFEVVEYAIGRTDVEPYGLAVQSNQYIWFGETATGRLTRLKIADGSMNIFVDLKPESHPFDLFYDVSRDYLWVTEFEDDQITQIELTTNKLQNSYDVPTPGGAPRGLTTVGSNDFWFSEYTSGRISRMVYTSPTSIRFDAFTLPVKGLFVPDIVADDDGVLWVVAYKPQNVLLPLVTRNYRGGPPPSFGIQMYGTVASTTGLSEVVAAGARWIRVPVSWQNVEPENVTPDRYNWASTDAQVAAITRAGIEPLLTLAGNPRWAAVYAMGPVTDVADLQEFVRTLVERYDGDGTEDAPGSPVARYLEIYNEPDLADEWRAENGGYGYFGYNGQKYAAILDAIYPVVKAASPRAQVVFGGLSSDNFDHEGGPTDPNFTDDVLANCTTPCFDVMNFHYFPFFRFRWEGYGRDIIGKAEFLRSKMASYGFDRPIMCTETTWYQANHWGSEPLQTRYVIAAFVRGMAAEFVLTNWFAWKDVDSGLPGLLDNELQPKPAYYAYQTLTEQLGDGTFLRALSTSETGDNDIEGYVFAVPVSGSRERRDVVWLDCDSLRLVPPRDCPDESRSMKLAADAVRVTNKTGLSSVIEDSEDGRVDGLVTLTITPDPIFIDYTP